MSDLISRSELLKEVEKYKFGAISDDAEREYIKKTILDFIICQPTAYDIEKVVEEFEQKKEEVQRMRNTCVALSDLEVCDIENVTYKRAIEIVKQGGVSDDVCEWKGKEKEYIQNPHTKRLYSNEESMENVYCNTCGKKIKVVE